MNRFIPFRDWVPPFLAFYYKFKSDEFLPDFVSKLEKKVIIEWSAGFSLTERITSLSESIEAIEDSNDPKLAVDAVLSHKKDVETKSRRIDFGKKDEVEKHLRNKLDDVRFYGIHGEKFAKYILLRKDMEMWDLENFPGYPETSVTVEHVLPQTPSEGSEWTNAFTKEERAEWTNKLGNLVLLSGRKNSEAQNYDFDKKREIYFKKRSTPFRITQELASIPVWNPSSVQCRHKRLVDEIIALYS